MPLDTGTRPGVGNGPTAIRSGYLPGVGEYLLRQIGFQVGYPATYLLIPNGLLSVD